MELHDNITIISYSLVVYSLIRHKTNTYFMACIITLLADSHLLECQEIMPHIIRDDVHQHINGCANIRRRRISDIDEGHL